MEIYSKLKNKVELKVEEKKSGYEMSLKKKKMEEFNNLLLTKQSFKFVK